MDSGVSYGLAFNEIFMGILRQSDARVELKEKLSNYIARKVITKDCNKYPEYQGLLG